MFEHYDLRKKLEMYFIVILIALSLLYGAFRAYPLLAGPRVAIYNPRDGDIVSTETFELSGQATRAKEVTINGRPIPIGTDGNFAETLIAQAPYSIIVITATDFYGKKITKTLNVVPRG
jgi:hypothetical protein